MGVKAYVVALLAALSAAAHADRITVVGAAGASLADVVIVGSGGEVWARSEAGWTRRAGGGVAATLVTAAGTAANDVWAMGPTAPPYHHDGTSWFAMPIAPGGAGVLAGPGSLPAVALGRRVVLLGREDGRPKWLELPALPVGASATAVWVSPPREALVGTTDGSLWRLAGMWKKLAAPLAPGERVVQFVRARSSVLALGSEGTLLAIDGRAKKLEPDARIAPFRARRVSGGARPLVLGEVDGAVALAAVDRDKIVPIDPAPPIGVADDAAALLALGADGVLVVTRAGTVLVLGQGQWATDALDERPPVEGTHMKVPPAEIAR